MVKLPAAHKRAKNMFDNGNERLVHELKQND